MTAVAEWPTLMPFPFLPAKALDKPGMSGRGVTRGGSQGRRGSRFSDSLASSREPSPQKHKKPHSLEIDTHETPPGKCTVGFWVCAFP